MIRSLPLMLVISITATTSLMGCVNEPELNTHVTPDLRDAAYPDLVPLDDLVAPLPIPQDARTDLEQDLQARSNRLERRAEALRRATN